MRLTAPDAIESMYFRRTDQNPDAYLMEFDMLLQKAEARMIMGSGFPDEFVSVLCVRNAALTKNEKRLALAS